MYCAAKLTESTTMAAPAAAAAARLVRGTPPAQLEQVIRDVRTLASQEDLPAIEAALPAVVSEVHTREFTDVQLPSGQRVLLTPDGLRDPREPQAFYDPGSRQLLNIDFGLARRSSTPGVRAGVRAPFLPRGPAIAPKPDTRAARRPPRAFPATSLRTLLDPASRRAGRELRICFAAPREGRGRA
jgi:hypothetical protein